MKVGILTTFYKWDNSYSLTSVVENQLIALVKNNYETFLFVHDNFQDDIFIPKGVKIKKVIPRFKLIDYSFAVNEEPHQDFYKEAEIVKEILIENLKNFDVVLTHDWIFQGWFLVYNVGMRLAQPHLKCRWLHWIHSAPSPRPANLIYPHDCRFTIMPNSKLIYMNHSDALRLAEMYNAAIDDVRIVFNPLDPRSFYSFHPLVNKLIDKYKLFDADIIDVYPVSSTRFEGKQVDKVIKVLSFLKKNGKSVRFVCLNAHANNNREKIAIENLLKYGESLGLTRNEMIFSSLEDAPQYEMGVPRRVVSELFLLSNLFIFPTLSENCPLILLEASLSKCLLVLNDDFPPLKDFFGPNALYFKFSSLLQKTEYLDEDKYFSDIAIIIMAELNKNKALNAFLECKKKFNYDYIFKNQLEPLFYEQF